MSVIQLMRAEYTIETVSGFPADIVELLAYLEAQFLNLRGYMQTTEAQEFTGVVEGPKLTIKRLFGLLRAAERFQAIIQNLKYCELPINEYTQSKFSIMTKSDGKLWRSEFKIKGQDLSASFFEEFARKKAVDLKLRGHMLSDSPEQFTGVVEGRRGALEKLEHALLETGAYKKKIETHQFTTPLQIAHYKEDLFEVTPFERQLFYCTFEIHGKDLPCELYVSFVQRKVQTAGVRGSIRESEGVYSGRLEGARLAIESIQESLSTPDEFVKQIDKCIFSELKPLEKYTTEHFSCLHTGNMHKIYCCNFEIKSSNMPKDIFCILADAHTELWGLHGVLRFVKNNCFRGYVEGSFSLIDTLKELMNLLMKITPITEVIFGQILEVENYSTSRFSIQIQNVN